MAKHLHSQYFVKSIAIKQLKEKVNSLIGLRLPTMPKQGWVRTIREALDMSGAQLGARLGISRNKISILERKEADGSITINQLKQLASGVDSELLYAIVPKQTVEQTIEERAYDLAKNLVDITNQHMYLEMQQLSPEKQNEMIRLLADEIKQSGGRALWKS